MVFRRQFISRRPLDGSSFRAVLQPATNFAPSLQGDSPHPVAAGLGLPVEHLILGDANELVLAADRVPRALAHGVAREEIALRAAAIDRPHAVAAGARLPIEHA